MIINSLLRTQVFNGTLFVYSQMNIVMFMFILGLSFIGHSIGLFTSENIVFQKSNEICINDAHWYVTFVHDIRPFQHLINQIQSDMKSTNDIISAITKAYKNQNMKAM